MQLELGQLIFDTYEGYRDTGIVIEVTTCFYGDFVYRIFWVCPREYGGYTTTLTYSEEELDMENSHCFENIE